MCPGSTPRFHAAKFFFFFFNDTATTEIYTLSLHDALPISWNWKKPGGGPPLSWYTSSACPPTISNHPQLHPPTLWCHSDAHCVSSHNHTTPVARLNLDQIGRAHV